MNLRVFAVLGMLAIAPCAFTWQGAADVRGTGRYPRDDAEAPRLPNGKNQQDEVLKAEHERNLKEASQLAGAAAQCRHDLEKRDAAAALKRIDEVERLVRRLRGRLTHGSGRGLPEEAAIARPGMNLVDAGQLVELTERLKEDLEKNDRFILSLSTLKKTDEIEKLVKRIRARLRHT